LGIVLLPVTKQRGVKVQKLMFLLFNLILYLFQEDCRQPEAMSGSPLSVICEWRVYLSSDFDVFLRKIAFRKMHIIVYVTITVFEIKGEI